MRGLGQIEALAPMAAPSVGVVTNVGALAGQTVKHLHFHVLSGSDLGSFN